MDRNRTIARTRVLQKEIRAKGGRLQSSLRGRYFAKAYPHGYGTRNWHSAITT